MDKIFTEISDSVTIKPPIHKSELIVGNITIRFEKRFNWLNRLMFKMFFGLTIKNIKDGE